jgi:hypothetical protein
VLQSMDALAEKSRLDLYRHRRARTRSGLIYKVSFLSSLRVMDRLTSSIGCNLIASQLSRLLLDNELPWHSWLAAREF